MKVTLIRHTSVAVESGICYGWTDVEVAPSFVDEAANVALSLAGSHFDAVFSSPLLRCRKLADFCGFPQPIIDERLKELNFGRWEMQKWEDITDPSLQLWYKDWIHLPAGGAESYTSQCLRVAHFLDSLHTLSHQEIGIFTHRGVIASAMVYAQQCTIEDSFSFDIPYGSTTIITL